jgi:hypothetical protein
MTKKIILIITFFGLVNSSPTSTFFKFPFREGDEQNRITENELDENGNIDKRSISEPDISLTEEVPVKDGEVQEYQYYDQPIENEPNVVRSAFEKRMSGQRMSHLFRDRKSFGADRMSHMFRDRRGFGADRMAHMFRDRRGFNSDRMSHMFRDRRFGMNKMSHLFRDKKYDPRMRIPL